MTWFQGFDYLWAQCSQDASRGQRKQSEDISWKLTRCCAGNPFPPGRGQSVLGEDDEVSRENDGISLDRSLKVPACMGSMPPWERLVPSCAMEQGVGDNDDRPLRLEENDSKVIWEKALPSFVESMKIGIEVEVVLDDGSLIDVELALDLTATKLLLRVRDSGHQVERAIRLDDIEQAHGGLADSCSQECVATCDEDRCVTLTFQEQFLTFCFDNSRLKEYFETCFTAMVSSRERRKAELELPTSCISSRDVVDIQDDECSFSHQTVLRERCQYGHEECA